MKIRLYIIEWISFISFILAYKHNNNKKGLQRKVDFGKNNVLICEDNLNGKCFPYMIYAKVPETSYGKDIVVTVRFQSYDYLPTAMSY